MPLVAQEVQPVNDNHATWIIMLYLAGLIVIGLGAAWALILLGAVQ